MKPISSIIQMCALVVLASGCASNVDMPLIFVQSNTAGISIGASAADQGADFVLGYKGSDFTVVPVAVTQSDGNTTQIKARAGEGHDDALSVFGQFKVSSNTDAKSPKIGLGRFFATGQAARVLAGGYAKKLGLRESVTGTTATGDCKSKTTTATTTPSPATPSPTIASTVASRLATASVASDKSAERPKTSGTTSLIFAEYVTFGLVLSGSATEQGAGVTLGYKDRDFAVVPVIARQNDGNATPLFGHTVDHSDALSVLGQFGADTTSDTSGKLEVGLGKFFTTGLAAKSLADGFAVKLCQDYVAPTK